MNVPAESDTPKTAMSQDGLPTCDALERQVNALEIDMPMDRLLEAKTKVDFIKAHLKEISRKLDEAFMAWIEQNGPIHCGTKMWFIGQKKDTKISELRPAVEALLNSCGGDFDAFCQCLSANALKYGACKEVMGDELWAKHFKVEVRKVVEEGVEKPVKELVEIDEQYTRRPHASKRT